MKPVKTLLKAILPSGFALLARHARQKSMLPPCPVVRAGKEGLSLPFPLEPDKWRQE